MPEKIQFQEGNISRYSYDASGVKHKAAYHYAINPTQIPLGEASTENAASNLTGYTSTDYCGNYIYENGVLKRILTPDGYIATDGGSGYNGFYIQHWKYNYFLKDHLGNTRVSLLSDKLMNSNSAIYTVAQINHYYPFGKEIYMADEGTATPNNQQPYLYNGKEMDRMHGLNMLDYGARWYDAALGRWGTVDPHAENYYSWSPYHYAANNPIRVTDPTGMDWYEFDQNGNYQKKTEMEGTNRIMIHTVEKTKEGYEYDSYKFVDFADPEKDAQDIDGGTINKLVFVGEKEMQSMMKEQGAFESGKLNFGWESQGGGDFDYSYSVLREKYPDANFNPKNMTSNSLFLPEGDNTAHNFMNFGNYLWGATGYTVGFDYAGLQAGAHANSLLNSRRNGYPAQWDSKDDQRSIIKGIYHAQTHNYRKLRK